MADGTPAQALPLRHAMAEVLAHLCDLGDDAERLLPFWREATAERGLARSVVLDARGVAIDLVAPGGLRVRHVGPVPWITTPEAGDVQGALAEPAHVITPAEALELLVARGVLPQEFADDARRAWWCAACEVGPKGKPACALADWQAHGERLDGTRVHPASLTDFVAVVSLGVPQILAAESLAREACARLAPWGVKACERVAWKVGERAGGRRNALPRDWPSDANDGSDDKGWSRIMVADIDAASEDRNAWDLRWWGAHVESWFDERPCPHAPVLALLRMGLALDSVADGRAVIACPAVGSR